MPTKERGKKTSAQRLSADPTQKSSFIKCPNCQADNLAASTYCYNCRRPLKESKTRTIKSGSFEISRGDLFAERYEIIEALGQGGMGKVFKACDRKINEVLALKIIRPEISANEKAVERFKNELKFARKISHRNVCRMYDLGEEGLFTYITMEYVAGEDLKSFIRRAGTLSMGKAVNIGRQICEGLAEAHRLGLVHRDLKPQNIMIDQDGNAKIMDFGIARFLDTDRMTGSGVMIGTPEYMSPEQVEIRDVDKRADIYSLGIVLYEMVSGRIPFDGETPLSIAMKHKAQQARNVRELNPQVPARLATVISQCMEKAPENRYQGAEELMEELSRVERDLATAERVVPKKASTPPKQITVSFQTKKLVLPGVLAVFLILAAVAVLKFLPGKKSLPPSLQTEGPGVQVKDSSAADSGAAVKQELPPLSAFPQKKQEVKSEKPEAKPAARPIEAKRDELKAPSEQPIISPKSPEMKSASLARARVFAAKSQVQKTGLSDGEPFFQLAEAQSQEAEKYLSQNNALEARTRFAVSERLYRIGLEKSNDKDRVQALKKSVENLKKELGAARTIAVEDEIYRSAVEKEQQGALFQAQQDFLNSAKSYVQAFIIYERCLLSLPSKKS